MELNLSENKKQIISAFILIVAPWIIMAAGMATGVQAVLFYIPMILWFGLGMILYQALN